MKNIECIDKTSILEFEDGRKTTVRIHETDSASANLMFLFEYGELNTKIIYAGQFTEARSILINDYIVQSIKMQNIDEVLIDNTMIDKKNSIEAACMDIRLLVRSVNRLVLIRASGQSFSFLFFQGFQKLQNSFACGPPGIRGYFDDTQNEV